MNCKIAVSLLSLIVNGAVIAQLPLRPTEPTAIVPLVMLGRSPAFYAQIDGHQALLELDTGSFELRLSPKFVSDNKLNTESVHLQIGDKIDEVAKPIVEEIAEPENPTLADRMEPHSDGIVGLDILRKYAIGVDDQSKLVAFWSGGKITSEDAKYWTNLSDEKIAVEMIALDLTSKSDEDWFRVQSLVNGKSLDLILDTGTAISTVNPSIAALLHLKQVGQTEVEEIGQTEVLPIVQADSLSFGSLRATFPIFNVESAESRDSDGILGTEALGQGKFLIDMPGDKLYVRRFSHFRDSNPLELRLRSAGLDFFPDSQNHLVVLVAPGSRADKAGIESGDRLESLGHLRISQLLAFFNGGGDADPKVDVVSLASELLKKDLTITVQDQQGRLITLDVPLIT